MTIPPAQTPANRGKAVSSPDWRRAPVQLLTRFVALGLTIDMIAAMVLVHIPNGFFLPNDIAFVLILAAASVALALAGAGVYSLDALMGQRRRAPKTAPPAYAASPRSA